MDKELDMARIAGQTAVAFGQTSPGKEGLGQPKTRSERRDDEVGSLLLTWRGEGKTYREIATLNLRTARR